MLIAVFMLSRSVGDYILRLVKNGGLYRIQLIKKVI